MTTQEPQPQPATVDPQEVAKRRKQKKDKVRSAWISFAGRIVAQMVGAIATVALGVMVLHKGSELRQPVAASSLASDRISVAVLPLDNFSEDAGHDYLADGLTDVLIADLAKLQGLRVVSRTSSMHFKGHRQALRDIADELDVRWIVEGSIARSGERVRITAQLIDAGADLHVWSETYDRSVADMLNVQAEVAGAIANAVRTALPSGAFGKRASLAP